jgi:hypothetical protein
MGIPKVPLPGFLELVATLQFGSRDSLSPIGAKSLDSNCGKTNLSVVKVRPIKGLSQTKSEQCSLQNINRLQSSESKSKEGKS